MDIKMDIYHGGNEMAYMFCKCEERLSTTEVPNDIELWVYTDKEWDAILEIDVVEGWRFPLPKYDVWQCPKCERLHVFAEKSNKIMKVYFPETADMDKGSLIESDIGCRCGAMISEVISKDTQLRVYSDREWDKILSVETIEPRKFPVSQYNVWRCPNCERVYVFESVTNKPIKIFALEK